MKDSEEPLHEPLAARKAKELVRKILVEGVVSYTDHALAEMKKDKMTTVDCENILRGGLVDEAEFENGAWRHHVRTQKLELVVEFESRQELVIVTAWRKR